MARRPRPSPLALLARGFEPEGRGPRGEFLLIALPVALLWGARAWGPSLLPGWSRLHEAAVTLPLALLLVPALGHALRRLNDLGWRGWWAWGFLLPWVRLALALLLLLVPGSQRRRRGEGAWRAAGLGVAGLAGLLLALSLLWTTAPVVAGGMKPGLLPGDLVLLRRPPLELSRGDVVAFARPGSPWPGLGRVVGLPGERVAVEGGVPLIDGAPAAQEPQGWWTETFARQGPLGVMPLCGNGAVGLGAACTTRLLTETLPGAGPHPVLDLGPRPLDSAPEARVPPGSLYLLGDHRDAAEDSRRAPGAQGTGLVPLTAVMGRVDRVLASSSAARWWDPRGWRPGRTLEAVP